MLGRLGFRGSDICFLRLECPPRLSASLCTRKTGHRGFPSWELSEHCEYFRAKLSSMGANAFKFGKDIVCVRSGWVETPSDCFGRSGVALVPPPTGYCGKPMKAPLLMLRLRMRAGFSDCRLAAGRRCHCSAASAGSETNGENEQTFTCKVEPLNGARSRFLSLHFVFKWFKYFVSQRKFVNRYFGL